MTSELWQRLKPLFHAALDRGPAERAEFIENACPNDPELKFQLIALVRAEEQGTESLASPLVNLPGLLDKEPVRFHEGQVILDRFRIVRSIDKGGMGEVYEATDLQLGTIALKTIRQDIVSSRNVFERFRQEVQLARRVSGPQVCRIHELFLLPAADGDRPTAFLTMEFLDGVTLSRKLKNDGPMPWKEALTVALDICEGLRLIHDKGIIHRDLKSGNIMLCKHDGSTRTVVMDFGLAHDLSIDSSSGDTTATVVPLHTVAGVILGTPAYMAPEQFEPGRPVSPATDIYALGIILYELVTGIHPYSANTPIGAAIRRAQHRKPASSIQRDVPRHLDHIIERCLEFEPEKRFQSAAEAAKALRAGPANLENLRRDRPWLLRAGYALAFALFAWSALLWWQERQQYHPGTEAQHWYDAGVAALREGDYTKATRSLETAVEREPKFAMGHARLAEAWIDLDFQNDAQREMLTASSGERTLAPADRRYFEAIHATVTGDYPAALEDYRRILDRAPASDRAAGYVDLGMAYERAGDLTHALDCYARASAAESDNAASYMHTAILDSRLHHVPEANRAFDRAEKIFTVEEDSEGLAELNYERGYAANDGGDAKAAQKPLQQSLQEAQEIGSVQLQIRVLSQLSSATNRFDNAKAAEYASQAIRLSRENRLDAWAANGLARLANAQVRQHKYKEAEENAREGLRLAHQSQQLRAEALANSALANLMNQEGRPDDVIGPAQSALVFYQKNGFFAPAATESMLLARAERDKGQYDQAFSFAKSFIDLASRSGNHDLTRQAEELLATILEKRELYPDALVHYVNAKGLADAPAPEQLEALSAANLLWRLGRYTEFEAMLNFTPTNDEMAVSSARKRVDCLLSRERYTEALALAGQTLGRYSEMDANDRDGLLMEKALAESHLHRRADGLKDLTAATTAETNTPQEAAARNLALAEFHLAARNLQPAQQAATQAAAEFHAEALRDSELRSAYLGATAAKLAEDSAAFAAFSTEIVDTTEKIQQTWTPQAAQPYFSRPDIQDLMRQSHVSRVSDRR